MTDHRHNLELKVQCTPDDLDRLRQRLDSLTCAPVARLHQVDTYVRVDRGRLKLREFRQATSPNVVERAELIAYDRATEEGSRWSAYRVVPIPGAAAPDLLAALLLTHDRLATVEKIRDVGLVGQTRVHLDHVTGLGAFVELETVMTTQGEDAAQAEHRQVIALFGMDRFPVVAGSYSDLVLAAGMA
jgi:adenylate cyclase class IV